jgi:hypothetical protein
MCMETAKRDPRCHNYGKARQLISTTSVSAYEERRRITPPSCVGLIFREAASKFRRVPKSTDNVTWSEGRLLGSWLASWYLTKPRMIALQNIVHHSITPGVQLSEK